MDPNISGKNGRRVRIYVNLSDLLHLWFKKGVLLLGSGKENVVKKYCVLVFLVLFIYMVRMVCVSASCIV